MVSHSPFEFNSCAATSRRISRRVSFWIVSPRCSRSKSSCTTATTDICATWWWSLSSRRVATSWSSTARRRRTRSPTGTIRQGRLSIHTTIKRLNSSVLPPLTTNEKHVFPSVKPQVEAKTRCCVNRLWALDIRCVCIFYST